MTQNGAGSGNEVNKNTVGISKKDPEPIRINEQWSSKGSTSLKESCTDKRRCFSRPEKVFKIIIVGDPTVGKTAFVQRYVCNTFRGDFKGTVGVDFLFKKFSHDDLGTIKLQLWDIAGQERFTWMTRVYYKDASGCVIMFDLSNRTSFLNTLKWKQDVDSKCMLNDGKPLPCILLGNKCDLRLREIDQMEIETFAKDYGFIGWTEVSAKQGLMVDDSMKFLVDTMVKQTSAKVNVSSKPELLKLGNGEERKTRGICSC